MISFINSRSSAARFIQSIVIIILSFSLVAMICHWGPYASVVFTCSFWSPDLIPMFLHCLSPCFAKAMSVSDPILYITTNKRYRQVNTSHSWVAYGQLYQISRPEPDVLYLALGLSCFENSEPRRLSLLLIRI